MRGDTTPGLGAKYAQIPVSESIPWVHRSVRDRDRAGTLIGRRRRDRRARRKLVHLDEILTPRAAGSEVGINADESDTFVGGRNLVFRQGTADAVGRAVPFSKIAEDALLHFVIVADGKIAVGCKNDRAQTAQLQALDDNCLGYAKACSDCGDVLTVVSKMAEGLELIRWMHGNPNDVLGNAEFRCIDGLIGNHARHGMSLSSFPSATRNRSAMCRR